MSDYSDKLYWEKRFQKEVNFDWLIDPQVVFDYIQFIQREHGRPNSAILHVGCGTSGLSSILAEKFKTQTWNSDIIETPLKHLINTDAADSIVLDYTSLECIRSGWFDIVVDKSVLDALACGDDNHSSLLKDVSRKILEIIADSGLWILISYSIQRAQQICDEQCKNGYTWKLIHNIPIEVMCSNVYTPKIYNYIYVLKKVKYEENGPWE